MDTDFLPEIYVGSRLQVLPHLPQGCFSLLLLGWWDLRPYGSVPVLGPELAALLQPGGVLAVFHPEWKGQAQPPDDGPLHPLRYSGGISWRAHAAGDPETPPAWLRGHDSGQIMLYRKAGYTPPTPGVKTRLAAGQPPDLFRGRWDIVVAGCTPLEHELRERLILIFTNPGDRVAGLDHAPLALLQPARRTGRHAVVCISGFYPPMLALVMSTSPSFTVHQRG